MKKKKIVSRKAIYSKQKIEKIFKEIAVANKFPAESVKPLHEQTDSSENWIIIGGSSKPNNKLIEISSWQTGQAY